MNKRLFNLSLAAAASVAAFWAAEAFPQSSDELDAYEPGVDTSALEPAVDTSALEPRAPQADGSESAESLEAAMARADDDIRRRTTNTGVMDEMDLGRTEITGNQELPKVLYIVPWQKSDPGELMGRPVNTLLDEVLAPLNRDEFVRQVDYYGELYGVEDEE